MYMLDEMNALCQCFPNWLRCTKVHHECCKGCCDWIKLLEI